MDAESTLIARVRVLDLRVTDQVLAVLLTVGVLLDASSVLHHGLDGLAIVSCIALTGSVAWRRLNPFLTTAVAVTGLAALVFASGYGGDGAFEGAAIALNFYTLGRHTQGRRSMLVSAVLFAYWLAGAAVIIYVPAGGSVGSMLGAWAVFGALPFAVGRTLETRSTLTRELAASTARLAGEQELRARRAVAEERNRMARELHDVIAHCVSVMVIQTSGARRVVHEDLQAAHDALRVVESSGRDALVELRRIVGALRRGHDELAGSAVPGLSQLESLVDRARAAGLPVELCVDGQPAALSPGLDLVAYRLVQEALTNAIKHAGPARASVNVRIGARELGLEVIDTGRGPATEQIDGASGHGLVGMEERVKLYGGELDAGPRASGGFEIRAQIPFDGIASAPQEFTSPSEGQRVTVSRAGGYRWPWLDPLVAAGLLAVMEITVLSSGHRRGPLLLNVIVVAGIGLAAVWRRRSPLLFLIAVAVLASVMNAYLIPVKNFPLIGAFLVLVPTYTVAAWEERRNATLGLTIFVGGTAIGDLINHRAAGNFAGAAFVMCAAWAAGRAIRARRVLTSELQRTSARLSAEREDRARLAVAGERSQLARELHEIVAHIVAAMVVQAEAAGSVLDRDPARADVAMSAIEDTGREALTEMRRILGVLRHTDDAGKREPQPGVDQIYALIQRARELGQPVELSVDGEPGTLPAGVDLGIYRILEDALQSARQQRGRAIRVAVRFGEEDLELHLTAHGAAPNGWPTDAMRERVALCGGELHADAQADESWQVVARMPRGLQGALA